MLVILIIWIADHFLTRNRRVKKNITYDRLDLIDHAKRNELEADLKIRFGIHPIRKVQVGDIDTLKGRVRIQVWLDGQEQLHSEE